MNAKEFNSHLDKIRNGDTKSLEKIYDAYSNLMFFVAVNVVKNTVDANDIMQDFFKYLLENAHSIGYIENPTGWICASIRNNAVRLVKEKSNVKPIDEVSPIFLSYSLDVDLNIVINDCINQLSENERTVFELHYFQGYKYREISQIMGRPLGTIKRDIHKIKNKLGYLKKYL